MIRYYGTIDIFNMTPNNRSGEEAMTIIWGEMHMDGMAFTLLLAPT